jgi:hypothetical protein
MSRHVLGLLALALLVSGLALAGTAIPPFDEVDRNDDGVIDSQEFHAVFPEAGLRAFDVIAGPDGTISREDWEEFREVHREGERMYGPDFHDRKDPQAAPDARRPGGTT